MSRRTNAHGARLIGSAANLCPQVDVHEDCTRLRLNNLLILFNINKLSGVVEIGVELTTTNLMNLQGSLATSNNNCMGNVQKCRFCTNPLNSETEVSSIFSIYICSR